MSITRHILFCSFAAALVVGCEDQRTVTKNHTDPVTRTSPAPAAPVRSPLAAANPDDARPRGYAETAQLSPAPAVEADNTGRNDRDRDPHQLTPGDQQENETDLTITQQVRREVVDNDALSMTAKNVKIITVDGVVTLRGPVNNAGEKKQVATIAERVTGVKRVDNQLEVASK